MTEFINEYFKVLLDCFKFDVMVYSTQMWMYWCLMIPITLYTSFFFAKWTILTAPMWLPLHLIFRGLGITRNSKEQEDGDAR